MPFAFPVPQQDAFVFSTLQGVILSLLLLSDIFPRPTLKEVSELA